MVLRQGELYVSACRGGTVLGILLFGLLPGAETVSLLATAVFTFALRAGSLLFGWRLPVYRPRPPRVQPRRTGGKAPPPTALTGNSRARGPS